MKNPRSRKAALLALFGTCLLSLSGCGPSNKASTDDLEPMAQAQPQAKAPEPSPAEPLGVERNGIRLVYPHDGDRIAAPSTWFAGAIAPGATLMANGQPVRVNAQGFFAHVVPLKIGANTVNLVLNGDPNTNFALTIKRPAPPKPVPLLPAQFLKGSMEPRQDIGAQPGDLIQFGVRASPGSNLYVKLGSKMIALRSGVSKIKSGLDTTFGVQYQASAASSKDFYSAFYKVNASDNWKGLHPEFVLDKAGTTIRQKSPTTITVLQQPFVATTMQDDTIVRVGPGAGRTTPIANGVRVLVDGWVGNSYRCEMAAGKHLWIEKNALMDEQGADAGTPPLANVRTINIENEEVGGRLGGRITVPLNQRLPYEVKQEVAPNNRLILKVYGATADTDWITEPSTNSNAVDAPHEVNSTWDRSHNPISHVTWQQAADRVYQITVNLTPKQQWGYWLDYDGTNLRLHIKGAPNVALSENSFRGLRICVDPGHGGRETGAIGCSGIKESTINLAIGQRFARMLRDLGAEVIMTRDGDVDVSLGDRVNIAGNANADILISIHNNSLPDGRNPWTEHGTSSYYYHPQSRLLANVERVGVVQDLGFPDYNTRWQNLALCRPTKMPATLVEVGFLNNPDEYATLLSEAGQQQAASGLIKGLRSFLTSAVGAVPTDPN